LASHMFELKNCIFVFRKVTDPAGEAPTDGAPDTVASEKSAKKMLKGSFRFGAFTKNLLTKDNVFAEILLISVRHPSAEDLNTVAEALQTELKVTLTATTENLIESFFIFFYFLQVVCPSVSYIVVAHVDQCGIFVKALEPQSPTTEDGVDIPTVPLSETVQSDGSFPVWIYLAYGSLRDDLFRANAGMVLPFSPICLRLADPPTLVVDVAQLSLFILIVPPPPPLHNLRYTTLESFFFSAEYFILFFSFRFFGVPLGRGRFETN
jgi:hypothetical protein